MRIEAKVGIFVVIGFVLLLVLSTQLSSVRSIGVEGYTIYAQIDNATGLNPHAKVKMNGVDVGEVREISLHKGKVTLALFIRLGIEIPNNSKLSLLQESMLGSKMVNITAGDAGSFFTPGEQIGNTANLASFEETSQKLADAADSFTKLMDAANNVLDDRRQVELKQAIDDLAFAIKDTREWLPGFESKASNLVDEYTKAGEELNTLIGDNSEPLAKAINSTEAFFATGKEALVKIDRILSSLTESELHFSIYGHYLLSDSYFKSFAGITYIPSPQTYYFLNIVSDNDYSNVDGSGNLIAPALHDEGVYRWTIQYGRRLSDFLFRAGWQDSTGGIGLDYFMFKDKLKMSAEVFDFNAANDQRSTTAHMNIAIRYRFLDHLDIYGGFDNILNAQSFNMYLGVGMNFIDDHLKALIGTTTLSSGVSN